MSNAALNNGSVNDVITDSVTSTSTLLTGYAAPQGMALLDVVSAETIGMAMHNAITAQQNAQLAANASVTTTCARMLSLEPVPKEEASEPEKSPPPFMPLSTGSDPNPGDPSAMLNMASTLADNAVEALKKQSNDDTAAQAAIQDLIDKLQKMSGGKSVSPTPAPTPSPTPSPAPSPTPTPTGSSGKQ